MSLHTALHRRPDQVVEQERSVDKQRKTEHLQPLECLPAKSKGHDPDEKSAAGVNGGTRRCGNSTCHTETEKVETAADVSMPVPR
jgi:predicted CxxxxCH...CXXCH cytochrome family protein